MGVRTLWAPERERAMELPRSVLCWPLLLKLGNESGWTPRWGPLKRHGAVSRMSS